VRQLTDQNNWRLKSFSREAMEALENYSWPGNVRELRNVVERVLLLAPGEIVDASTVVRALPQPVTANSHGFAATGALAAGGLAQRVEAFERETLLAELKRHHHHMTNTAKALGLERSHLYKKCQQLGIDLRVVRQNE
jgi:two-component system nitrogen regulation response regulator NtrX